MISYLFHNGIYVPLYNGLVFLVDVVPAYDMGLAVIALTIVVRIIIYPLSQRAIHTQIAMKKIAPDVEKLKIKHKDNREEQGRAIFALYRERDVHPFASIGLVLIQFPVLIGLYWVFYAGGFPTVDPSLLYAFIHVPPTVNMEFLGFVDMGEKHNVFLAVLVALSQLVYSRLSMGPRQKVPDATPVEASFSGDFAKSFDLQARYVFPVMFGVISYFIVAAAPLYWFTSNVFMIGQEFVAGRRWKG
jgi:YidC/Oxa1 family membrane protein insertase